MPQHNEKGFTLIESIITFAILALAGSMFIFGFMNVSNIASEGSIIKTETDNLFNELLSESDPQPIIEEIEGKDGQEIILPVPETTISIKFEGDSNTKTLQNIYISKKNEKIGDFDISLSRIIPLKKLESLPNNVPDEPVVVDQTINTQFKIIKSNHNLPVYNITTKSWTPYNNTVQSLDTYLLNNNGQLYSDCMSDKLSNQADGLITKDVEKYLAHIPSDLLSNAQSNCEYYAQRSWLWIFKDSVPLLSTKPLTIKWFAIEKVTSGTNIATTVYGFLVPTNGQYAIYNGKMDIVSAKGFGAGLGENGLDLPNGNLTIVNTIENTLQEVNGSNINGYVSSIRNSVFGTSSGLWYIY